MIQIVYACNDGFIDCLGLSILSIIRRTKEPIHFYVLTQDFTDLNSKFTALSNKNELFLRDMVKSYNQLNEFTKIDCKNIYEKFLKGNKNEDAKCSPYTNLRLLLDKVDISGKVIYLDTDVMCCGDIIELWNIDLGQYSFAANRDWWLRYLSPKDYFNCGVLLLNLDRIRKIGLFDKTRGMLFNKKFNLADQTVLWRVGRKMKEFFILPYKFKFNTQGPIQDNTLIKHFNAGWVHPHGWQNIKQNDIEKVHKWMKIFIFDEDYKTWEQIKKINNIK